MNTSDSATLGTFQSTLAGAWLQKRGITRSLATDALLVTGGSLLIALTAQIEIPVGGTLVPITGQTLGVLLCGAALGSRRGFAAVVAYLIEGGMGLPFFSGGAFGWARIIGPSGGYLVGFLAAAFLSGWIAERRVDRNWRTAIPAFIAAQVVIYAFGMPWLGYLTGFDGIWLKGFVPFIPGLLIKSTLAGLMLPSFWRSIRSLDEGTPKQG